MLVWREPPMSPRLCFKLDCCSFSRHIRVFSCSCSCWSTEAPIAFMCAVYSKHYTELSLNKFRMRPKTALHYSERASLSGLFLGSSAILPTPCRVGARLSDPLTFPSGHTASPRINHIGEIQHVSQSFISAMSENHRICCVSYRHNTQRREAAPALRGLEKAAGSALVMF